VSEICHKILLEFIIDKHTDFLSENEIEKHIKYAEKFDFDPLIYKTEIFPLETLSLKFIKSISNVVKRPTNNEQEFIYQIFGKMLAFYMIVKKLASMVKTEEGMELLNLINSELNYLLENCQSSNLLALNYKKIKVNIEINVKDCLERLSTIISFEHISQDSNILYFLNLPLENVTFIDISNIISNLINSIQIKWIEKLGFTTQENLHNFVNDVYEECQLQFYAHQKTDDPHNAITFVIKANHLDDYINTIKTKNPLLFHLISIYIYLQFLLAQNEIYAEEDKFLLLEKQISRLSLIYITNVKDIFNIDNFQIEAIFHKINQAISDMRHNGIRINCVRNILEMDVADIHINDILDTINALIYDYIDTIRLADEKKAETVENFYLNLFNQLLIKPINFKEYLIPPKYHNQIFNYFKNSFLKDKNQNLDTITVLAEYPFLFELLAHYYFYYSLSIDRSWITKSLIPILLYCEMFSLIKNEKYRLIYKNSASYFRQFLEKIFFYAEFLCEASSANAFIIRAMILGFTVKATFSQGSKEYFELEDGLCAGYVYQIAEYILIEQERHRSQMSRSYRWNIKERSPFEFTVSSPFQQVIANSRTYDFQSKKLHEVTDAMQMQQAISGYRFHSGADIAEKLLELIKEHPDSVFLLGMWEAGVKIGHAVACFVQDYQLHFFCATHSWLTIAYSTANPALHAFLHLIFNELPFFSSYSHFWIGIIHRPWEAMPIDESNFHYEHDETQMPFCYNKKISNDLEEKALDHFYERIRKRQTEITRLLFLN